MPKSNEYRGWRITKEDQATQLGYRIGDGSRPGKGRFISGYTLFYAADNVTKFVGTLKHAKEYIDSYMGDK